MKKATIVVLMLLSFSGVHSQTVETIASTAEIKKNVIDFSKSENKTSKSGASVKLNDYYKANDGTFVFVRQIGNIVYALTDRYDRRASSIWVGKIQGRTLKVNYYYTSKGKAKGQGVLEFNISGSELKLATAVPEFNFNSMKTMAQLPAKLPIDDRAWYRGNTLDNLTGRYTAKNVGRMYVLDLDGQIFAYVRGARKTSHTRPQFASLFIGKKENGKLKGCYVDLPLGHTLGQGVTELDVIGPQFIRSDRVHFFYGVDYHRNQDDTREIIQ